MGLALCNDSFSLSMAGKRSSTNDPLKVLESVWAGSDVSSDSSASTSDEDWVSDEENCSSNDEVDAGIPNAGILEFQTPNDRSRAKFGYEMK